MKRLLFNTVQGITRLAGYDLAKQSSYSLGNSSSVAAIAAHLKDLFRELGTETVIDVGANKGQYYDFLRDRADFRGRIVSFEPIPEHAQELTRRSSADPLWSVHNMALGRQRGTLPLNISDKTGWSSLLRKSESDTNEVVAAISIERVVDVQVHTLDEVFAGLEPDLDPSRCYLKLDSQGFDLEIMRGAPKSLPQLTALQSELELLKVYEQAPDYLEVLAFLRSQGFSITGLFPIWADKLLRIGEVDAVFRKAG